MKYRNHTGGLASFEPHYSQHVQAMTAEELHSKSDIAAELAVRDARIAELEKAVRKLFAAAEACDREAERPPESRSSAPVVQQINAMAALRAALRGQETT